ncbi:MAG: metabolite traffic protein EboE [Lentisphaeria bacterium]|nr:metabolite traffic protein EboE [Lentisphaeria bacterium]
MTMMTATPAGRTVLCHCMNVFPGTTPQAKLSALFGCLTEVRQRLTGDDGRAFPVGLWLDAATANALHQDAAAAAAWTARLHGAGFRAVTANAFPYGRFHDAAVKTGVYHPDWTCPERRDYTIAVADLLADMLPEGQVGSISTLPAGYRRDFPADGETPMLGHILAVARHLAQIRARTGKTIRLGFEMEPDCLWEDPAEFADFFARRLRGHENAEFVGVCYDTCHQELLARRPGEGLQVLLEAGIPIVKIQLSAAIQAPAPSARRFLVQNFQDTVYLHQTRALAHHRIVQAWNDLPPADCPDHELARGDEWRCHFHVPVFLEHLPGGLQVAKAELLAVLAAIRKSPAICPTLEIETYSYNVLPDFLKSTSLADCLVREAQFILAEQQS